jgi:DNA-binding LacI/PurR family transcriptional regulator
MATIKAVAQQAGVSITTVSHALNHPERVTPELRERVLRAVDALGYEPHPSARTLRLGRTKLLALLLPDLGNPFFPELARAVQDALAPAGYDALIFSTEAAGAAASTGTPLRQLRPQRFDGALLVGEAIRGAEDELASLPIPAVHIGNLAAAALDSVTFDDVGAAYDATAYLLRRGHRRIAHIAGDKGFWSGRARRQGYEQALRDHRYPVDESLIVPGAYDRASGAAGMRTLLQLDSPPTAVFVANGLMALAALGVVLDAGWSVPGDLALVAFDDIDALTDVRPQLTAIAGSPRALGQAAAELLLQRLREREPSEPRRLVLPHTLVRRASA